MSTSSRNIDLIRVVEELRAKRIIKKDVDIIKATGYSAGVVSNYLGGKAEASKKFIETFETSFGVKIKPSTEIITKKITEVTPLNEGEESTVKEQQAAYGNAKTDENLSYQEKYYKLLEEQTKAFFNSLAEKISKIETNLDLSLQNQMAILTTQDAAFEELLNDVGVRNGVKNLPSTVRKKSALALAKFLELDK